MVYFIHGTVFIGVPINQTEIPTTIEGVRIMSTNNVSPQPAGIIPSNLLLPEANAAKYGQFTVKQSADGTQVVLSNKRYEITIDSAGGQRNISVKDKLHREKTDSKGDPHLNDAAGNRIFDYKEDLQMNYQDMEVFIETTPPEKTKNGVPVAWAQTVSIKDDAGNVIQVDFGDPKQRKKDLVLDVTHFYGNKADEQIEAVQQRFEGTVIWEDGKDTKKNDGSYGSSSFFTKRVGGDPVSQGWLKKIEANNTSHVLNIVKSTDALAKKALEDAKALQNHPNADIAPGKENLLKDIPELSNPGIASLFQGMDLNKMTYRDIGIILAGVIQDKQEKATKLAKEMTKPTDPNNPDVGATPKNQSALTALQSDMNMLGQVIANARKSLEETDGALLRRG